MPGKVAKIGTFSDWVGLFDEWRKEIGVNRDEIAEFKFDTLYGAFETELNLFGLDRAIERVELKLGDFITIDADLLAPLIEEADPVTEGSNFCYLAWHKTSVFSRSASVPAGCL